MLVVSPPCSGLPSAVGVAEVLGPWRWDAVLVVPAGVTGVGEFVEVGLAGQSWAEFAWGVWVYHAAGSSSGRRLVAGGVGAGSGLPTAAAQGEDIPVQGSDGLQPIRRAVRPGQLQRGG